jgi:hypothetical protein
VQRTIFRLQQGAPKVAASINGNNAVAPQAVLQLQLHTTRLLHS